MPDQGPDLIPAPVSCGEGGEVRVEVSAFRSAPGKRMRAADVPLAGMDPD
jgi:hypothetical protein